LEGRVELSFTNQTGRTRLDDLYQQGPLRVLFPRVSGDDMPEAVIATTSGGLVGGDNLGVDVSVGCGAQAIVTTQAAEKVYRSIGPDVGVTVNLCLERDGWLEWMPQETIIFDGARLRRRIAVNVVSGARALAGEVIAFGRSGRGERLTTGLLHDEWRVVSDGRLVWADNLHLDGDIASKMDAKAGFQGCNAMATFVYAAADAPRWLDSSRQMIHADGIFFGVTCIDTTLVARWLGNDVASVRNQYKTFREQFRCMAEGFPAVSPRIWTS
jgi:urease accessory protein